MFQLLFFKNTIANNILVLKIINNSAYCSEAIEVHFNYDFLWNRKKKHSVNSDSIMLFD